ncbi:hypothetical protein HN51_051851 [Arachis hypogaea]
MWENDDLGHAMSRSSVEDLEQPNAHEGYNLGTDNDDYGKALQDSLNSSAYPPYFTYLNKAIAMISIDVLHLAHVKAKSDGSLVL